MLHTKWTLFRYKLSDNYVNTVDACMMNKTTKLRNLLLCIMFQIEFYRWDLITSLNMFAIISSLSFTVSRSMVECLISPCINPCLYGVG